MPAFVKDEAAWEKAKKRAADEGQAGNYAYIMGIYKKMTGQKAKGGDVETSKALGAFADEVLEKGAALQVFSTAEGVYRVDKKRKPTDEELNKYNPRGYEEHNPTYVYEVTNAKGAKEIIPSTRIESSGENNELRVYIGGSDPYAEKSHNPLATAAEEILSKAVGAFELPAQSVSEIPCAQLMTKLLGTLKAIFWSHWTAHWQTGGPTFYADHELFGRLYDEVKGEIDSVAERAIGYFGIAAVDPSMVLQYERQFTVAGTGSDLVARALDQERRFMACLQEVTDGLKARGKYTMGLDDLLPAIASTHDGHLYLLQQRSGA